MLNKAICKRCCKRMLKADGRTFEKYWRDRILIACFADENWYPYDISDQPPNGCPFILEQTVTNETL